MSKTKRVDWLDKMRVFLENAAPDSEFEGMNFEQIEELYAIGRFYYMLKDLEMGSFSNKEFSVLYLPKKRLSDAAAENRGSNEFYYKIAASFGIESRTLERHRTEINEFFKLLKTIALDIFRDQNGEICIKLKGIEF